MSGFQVHAFTQTFQFNMQAPVLPSLTVFNLIFQNSLISLTSVSTMLFLPTSLHNLGYQVYPSLYGIFIMSLKSEKCLISVYKYSS